MAARKVFVGLSGGVDSAVSAAVLQKQGAEVRGVFIKGWYPPNLRCTWAEDRKDAMRVAARLRIPFTTLDASKEYKKAVIDYLLSEYKAGRTPNPDIMCNREVKFGAFYSYAMAQGADYIATGHYARAENGTLLRGIDPAKDQSYFLWAIDKEALAHTIFPLGGYQKEHTRRLARECALPVAEKKDSQGICFLGSVSVEEFLGSEFGSEHGEAVDESGTRVGTHNGALLHTLGERLSLEDAPSGPWYVIGKDIALNRLVVSRARTVLGSSAGITFTNENWFGEIPSGKVDAQYRYHGPIVSGILDSSARTFVLDGEAPEPIAPGQSLVIYRGDQCFGGAIIG